MSPRRRRNPGEIRSRCGRYTATVSIVPAITVGSVEVHPVPVELIPEYNFTGEGERYRKVITDALAGDRAANVEALAALVRHVAKREAPPRVLLEFIAAQIQKALTEPRTSLDQAFRLDKPRVSRRHVAAENDPLSWRLAGRVAVAYAVQRRQREIAAEREARRRAGESLPRGELEPLKQAIKDVAKARGMSEATVKDRWEWWRSSKPRKRRRT